MKLSHKCLNSESGSLKKNKNHYSSKEMEIVQS